MRFVALSLICLATTLSLLVQNACAQPGGGDRGNRGSGSGFPGGGGVPGAPGGGFQGGGPTGGFQGAPGSGGFPGGGFQGGMRGSMGGGERGGGDRGSVGGGFNPADMLKRFDRNNNNMIDPDEAEGPAKFFLERVAQNNPKIDLKRPVPLDTLTQEMERMRGGGGPTSSNPAEPEKPALLVPDFSGAEKTGTVPGFGMMGTAFNVTVTERDLKDAEERIRRYDKNNDGLLTKDELSEWRGGDDPLQFDRNQDGKLSKSEFAVRYAKRRTEEANQPAQGNDARSRMAMMGGNNGWKVVDPNAPEGEEPASRFDGAKSYRMTAKTGTLKGLPDWFARTDADSDGQILMSEYSSSWTNETLAEFQKFDMNRDGIITGTECLSAIRSGVSANVASSRSSSTSSSASGKTAATVSEPTSSPSAPGEPTATAPSTTATASAAGGSVEIEWATRQIAKYDKNGDTRLTVDEWEKMLVKPEGADADGDGAITVQEYAAFRASKK